MKLVYKNLSFCVFDDLLPLNKFEQVLNYIEEEDYTSVHANKWNKIFRLLDGNPMQGTPVFSHKPDKVGLNKDKEYPTQSGIDVLMEEIINISNDLVEWIGTKDVDWHIFTATAYLYQQGAGLSWHCDSFNKTGAFIFYAHPYWNVQWGGELFIADISEPLEKKSFLLQHLNNTEENQKLLEIGMGKFIMPKPNRLVIIKGGYPHMINRVNSAAGDHARHSISGFFLKKQY